MQPGIYHGLSFEEYRAIQAINKSGLDIVARSPAHFKSSLVLENKQTPAMKLGAAIHCAVLEPDELSKRYICEPTDGPKKPTVTQINAKKPSPATLEAIEFWQNFAELAAGRTLLTVEESLICSNIFFSIHRKPAAAEFLTKGKAEVTIVWRDGETGVLCKARLDWLTDGAIVDLKSTTNAHPDAFVKQIYNMNWHRQAAWYADGMKVLTGEDHLFVFAAVEKESPFESAFYYVPDTGIELGRSDNRQHLNTYAKATREKQWHGYTDDLITADPPGYLIRKAESE